MRDWIIPKTLWAQTLSELSRDGSRGCEGICLWLTPIEITQSKHSREIVSFTRGATLRGPLIRRCSLMIEIDSQLLSELTDVLDRQGLMLAGQVHGHPERFIDLSDVDRAMGFRVPGFLSIVTPHYGVDSKTSITECGFHEFIPQSGYRRLADSEVATRVTTVDRSIPPLLVVGEDQI